MMAIKNKWAETVGYITATTIASLALLLSAGKVYSAPSSELISDPVFMCGSGLTGPKRDKDSLFESVPARPLALSDDGSLLFVINSPASCLEIYAPEKDSLRLVSSLAVGVDPVAVAVRSKSEIWVVNHISDSVNIINIEGQPHIQQTLQVGDAPWDIVFANSPERGKNPARNYRDRAFITSSFLGQNHPQFKLEYLLLNRLETSSGKNDGELIGRTDLWVYDIPEDKPPVLAGLINAFTTHLRSLSVDSHGTKVFATAFKSGNRTAITPIPFDALPAEKWSAEGVANVEPFAIVQQQDDGRWLDVNGNEWEKFINFDVSDQDLFVIDATAELELGNSEKPIFNRHAILKTVEGVGNILFNNIYDEKNNRVLISAVDANNLVPMHENLKGDFVSNQLKVVDLNQSPARVTSINLDTLLGNQGYKPGFALPGGLLTRTDGSLMVAGMGVGEMIAFNPDQVLKKREGKLKNFEKIQLPSGPVAIIQDDTGRTLYSYNYIDSSISVMKERSGKLEKTATIALFNPELEVIASGRKYLYDAVQTSSNNRVSCASCHIYAGDDRLQWVVDQANQNVIINHLPFVMHADRKVGVRALRMKRDGETAKVGDKVPFGDIEVEVKYVGDQKGFADKVDSGEIPLNESGFVYLTESEHDKRLTRFKIMTGSPTWALIETPFFHSLRGPMRTTPLYGLADSGVMHYLGDKSGLVLNETGPCSDRNATQAERAFHEFNAPCDGGPGAFETLLGGSRLPDKFMDDLTQFALAIKFPPNPVRPLDNQVNRNGETIFKTQRVGTDLSNWDSILHKGPLIFSCAHCHTLDREQHLFGTSNKVYAAPPLSIQDAKIPHLRYLYDRAGFLRGDYRKISGFLNMKTDLEHFDKVVHAQGLNHGGWFDFSMFFADMVWVLNPKDPTAYSPETNAMYLDLFEYLMEFDTNYFPMYGKQITVFNADLDNPSARRNIASFMQNNLSTVKEIGEPQCSVRIAASDDNHPTMISINNLDALRSAIREASVPVTLTCL